MQIVKTVTAIVAIVLLLPFASLAQQTPLQQPGAEQPPVQQTDLSESQLRSFAKVYVKLRRFLKPMSLS